MERESVLLFRLWNWTLEPAKVRLGQREIQQAVAFFSTMKDLWQVDKDHECSTVVIDRTSE